MMPVEARVLVLETKMDEVTKAITELKTAITALDQKADRRFDASEAKSERHFFWLLGTGVTTLVAIIAGMFGIIAKLI